MVPMVIVLHESSTGVPSSSRRSRLAAAATVLGWLVLAGLTASSYVGHSSSPYGVCYAAPGRGVPLRAGAPLARPAPACRIEGPVKLLVLGGTLFLGRHVVAAALARGFQVATFTRGRTNPTPVDGVEALHGDRDGDLSVLRRRRWDVVVDTSGYHPRQIETAASALDDVGHYIFVSTGSVYREFTMPGALEEAPTHMALLDPHAQLRPETYGPLKAACEEAALRRFQDRATIVRPGVLVGPLDPTDRLPYWVRRIAASGEVLSPGLPDRLVQLLDARDLANWLLALTSTDHTGIFNAAGPADPLSMQSLLTTCAQVARSTAELTWVDDAFLLANGVIPWTDLPLWLPAEAGPALRINAARAQAAGLRFRPIAETIADVLAETRSNDAPLAGGLPKARPMTRPRELELLMLWRARTAIHHGIPSRDPAGHPE
jgi:2'-hydroxyisoflavone reductase